MHLLLLLIAVIIVIPVIVKALPFSTLLGGNNNYNRFLSKTNLHHQHKHKHKHKTNVLESPAIC